MDKQSTSGTLQSTSDSGPRHENGKWIWSHENCVDNCKYDGNEPTNCDKNIKIFWIRCCGCARWFHPMCVGLSQDEAKGVWPCCACDNISAKVADLQSKVDQLLDMNTTMMDIIRKCASGISQTVDGNNNMTDMLRQFATGSQPQTQPEMENVKPPEEKFLLITDSLGRDVLSTNQDLLIKVHGGAKVNDINKDLQDLCNNRTSKWEHIIILCGTNDCSTKMDVAKIGETAEILLKYACDNGDKVTLSSIPPRNDSPDAAKKVDHLNQLYKVMTNSLGIKYVNNDDNFTYRSGDMDRKLFIGDHLHLSEEGTVRLINNLGLASHARFELAAHNPRMKQFKARSAANQTTHQPSQPGVPGTAEPNDGSNTEPASFPPPPPPPPPPPHPNMRMPQPYVPPPPPPPPPPSPPQMPYHPPPPPQMPSQPPLLPRHTHPGRQTKQGQRKPWSAGMQQRQQGDSNGQWPSAPDLVRNDGGSGDIQTVKFRSADHPLSNFFPCSIDIYGRQFKSSEHAYQYRKAVENYEWDLAEEIVNAPTALKAKQISNKIKDGTSTQWDSIKEGVMYEVLQCKAQQCSIFRNTLQCTVGNYLAENTSDMYWAIGSNGKGQNRLGHLLMKLRDQVDTLPLLHHTIIKDNNQVTNRGQSVYIEGACWYCGEENHNSAICRHGRKIRCHACGLLGHKKKSAYCSQSDYNQY